MDLARVAQSGADKAALEIGRAMRESGLSLLSYQIRDIAEAESSCLSEWRRVSFGESAAARIVCEFATSPFISVDDAAKDFANLTESFYELRESFPAQTTDAEILETLREAFDGDAAGDVGLTLALTRELLLERLDYSTYEIIDDDGNVYRWSPEEWRDDVMADGWCGEQWGDSDE